MEWLSGVFQSLSARLLTEGVKSSWQALKVKFSGQKTSSIREGAVSYKFHKARIPLGDFHEFLSDPDGRVNSMYRIYHKGFGEVSDGWRGKQRAALLAADLGGAIPRVTAPAEEAKPDGFLVPLSNSGALYDAAIVSSFAGARHFSFFKCRVTHINEHTGEVEIEIAQASA